MKERSTATTLVDFLLSFVFCGVFLGWGGGDCYSFDLQLYVDFSLQFPLDLVCEFEKSGSFSRFVAYVEDPGLPRIVPVCIPCPRVVLMDSCFT